MTFKKSHYSQAGFSLVEMAIVLIILGFVIAALLLPIQAQRDQNFRIQTENAIAFAQKALIGYAQSKGRLPCPATVTSNGLEQPLGGTTVSVKNCVQQSGYLPASTLGIQPTNENGFLVDAWNNPIRYAVSQKDDGGIVSADFTTTNDLNTVGIANLNPNLLVCSDSANCSTTTTYLTNNAVAVIFSTGKNYLQTAGTDEAANLVATTTYYSRTSTAAGSSLGEFDDIVAWISPFVLYNAMIQAGQLH